MGKYMRHKRYGGIVELTVAGRICRHGIIIITDSLIRLRTRLQNPAYTSSES